MIKGVLKNQIKSSDTKRLIEFLRSKLSTSDSIDGEKVARSRLNEIPSPLAVEVLLRSLRHSSNDTKMTGANLRDRLKYLSQFLKLKRLDEEKAAKLFEISVISSYRTHFAIVQHDELLMQPADQEPLKLLFMFAPDSSESQAKTLVARLSRNRKINSFSQRLEGT